MTQAEFLEVIRWTMPHLAGYVSKYSPAQIMFFRKSFQMALTKYSKGKSSNLDSIQEKALAMMSKIDKWMRHAYIDYHTGSLRRNGKMSKIGVKSQLREDFEEWKRKQSY